MAYLDIRGIRSYTDVTGAGEPVVFLHGGLCSAEVMRELAEQLDGYAVHAPERPGHGRTPDRPGAFHYDDGVADTLAALDALGLDSAHLVGFSDGANIGMLLALAHPERVRSLVHISGNLRPGDDVFRSDYTERADGTAPESDRVSAEWLELSPDGPERYDDVLARILHLWTTEPAIEPASLAGIAAPVLVMAGDGDIVALDHTREIHRALPDARLAIVPGTSHMLVRERPALVAAIVQHFLDDVRG